MDPRLEDAMETLRAIDQATERIDAMIERAGGPMVVCKNVQESDADKRASRLQMLYDVADYRHDGDLLAYPAELVDTIDRLEAALYNVINEREQLIFDLKKIVDEHSICNFCLHDTEEGDEEECLDCANGPGKWEWRGVPDKEEESDEH